MSGRTQNPCFIQLCQFQLVWFEINKLNLAIQEQTKIVQLFLIHNGAQKNISLKIFRNISVHKSQFSNCVFNGI